MQVRNILPVALASIALAQEGSQRNLTAALASQNSSLSSLITLLGSQPGLVGALSQAQNITILAPSNAALEAFLASPGAQGAASNPGLITAILQYHVLTGTYYASQFTEEPRFIPTLLTNETYTNVTGGQRVQAQTVDGNVTFYSALRENSTVTAGNVNFTAGTIHIIDKVLSVPQPIPDTLRAANLTAALGAIEAANVGPALTAAKDLTIFIPNNEAFRSIGNLTANLTAALPSILQYHVVAGSVLYSPDITNTSLTTLNGGNVTIRVINGTVYVNEAEVLIPNVLISNGVVHVIDNVLNPNNTSVEPDTTASTRPPAYTDAGTATDGSNPFTSGITGPTSTAPLATETGPNNGGGVRSTSSSTEAGPIRTAAVGAAALFGGMAAYMNI
ncbi:fasciclin domain-containing protein [Colletotrichum orchidophilum]|uniref:Fasciclin domain-containing protein n=1 Tax=Colletotrichum orchidophilum TaxID=1209926 RepID=A0A1G4BR19_9PEZI|nr:fasciclin domain-containing protein [Colletotrichum orchidophilum]OHF03803.1 fasciclin domain-containing protein [Colletotrichum orchidophilum]